MPDAERFARKNKSCCAGVAELHQTAIFIGAKPRLVFSFKDFCGLHFVAAFLNRIQVISMELTDRANKLLAGIEYIN
ncbi:MAG: hypothetical protein KDD56_05515 [Bdellovibrionales bacterium]|nr:hypothetical protein [Bdellovibrionales bacterium]